VIAELHEDESLTRYIPDPYLSVVLDEHTHSCAHSHILQHNVTTDPVPHQSGIKSEVD